LRPYNDAPRDSARAVSGSVSQSLGQAVDAPDVW
jgi:hypothetical protein